MPHVLAWAASFVAQVASAQDEEPPADEVVDEPTLEVAVGGAVRFNIHYKSWEREHFDLRAVGSFDFDTFRVDASGAVGDLSFSTQYRFYAGYNMLHHGWVAYRFSALILARIGVHQVPFGLLPYASHNWFFQLPYYVGLEDDHDAGAEIVVTPGAWELRLAYFPNDEGHFTGSSLASARYSYDVVPALAVELDDAGEGWFDEEENQIDFRLARSLGMGGAEAELGLSGQYGSLRNTLTDELGDHWAAAAHLEGDAGPWNLKAEVIRYELRPERLPGAREDVAVMGAYDAPYFVSRAANLYVIGLACTIPVDWGPLESVQLYDDYSYLHKSIDGHADSQQNVLGTALSAGPLYVYVDVASGRNHPWLGSDYTHALGVGGGDGWSTRLNTNLGIYY